MPISGKQCQGQGPFAILIEDFNRSAPAFVLSIVGLSKVKHLPGLWIGRTSLACGSI
jgi:hypothetical protein